MPAGTRMVEISGRPWSRGPVTAATATTLVMSVPALVMNTFVPLITHSSSARTALVAIAAATSEPPPGSVRPNAPSRSPEHSPGSH